MKTKFDTREEWLHAAIKQLKRELFKQYKIPAVKVSVGLPYGRGSKKAIGQHWHPAASDDKVGSIFISPTVDDDRAVLGILIHELIHAIAGNEAGHGKEFRKIAIGVGLVGRMVSTTPGKELTKKIKKLIRKIGPYPHAKLNLNKGPIKKQSTRMVKVECLDCGYIVRTSRKNIEERGPTLCPCNHKPMWYFSLRGYE